MRVRKVGLLARWLFIELLAMADFTTGQIRTSYPILISLLDFDHVPGAHATPKLTARRLELALQLLCELKLIKDLDPLRNQRLGGLFFRVDGRGGISAANERSVDRSVDHRKAAKRATARVSKGRTTEDGGQERVRVQERDIPPSPPHLSTPKPTKFARDALAVIAATKARRAGFK